MFLLTFYSGKRLRLGVRLANGVLDVKAAYDAFVLKTDRCNWLDDPVRFFRAGTAALQVLRDVMGTIRETQSYVMWVHPEEELRLGPCVPEPGKILCASLNYPRHAAEVGIAVPRKPLLYCKLNNAIAPPRSAITLSDQAKQYDYEAELVVVIGREAYRVPEERALEYVLGYCNGNDISARDFGDDADQWLLGKTMDGFLPIGPYVVTPEDAGDPQAMPIRCWLNDELRQDACTSEMVFSVAQIISYASRYMTLYPGDIITTGTPAGVILGRSDQRWMHAGDRVTVQIGRLGRLENCMARVLR